MNLRELGKKATRCILKINILGSPPEFNVGGKTTPPSWTGVLLSLAFIGVLLFLGFIFAKNSLDTTNPEIKIEVAESSVYPEIDLFRHKFFVVITPSTPTPIPNFNANGMMKVAAVVNTKRLLKNDQGETFRQIIETIPLQVKNCTEVVDTLVSYLKEHEAFGGPTLQRSFCVIPPKDKESIYKVRGQGLDDLRVLFP